MTDREIMQQALEALERCVATCFDQYAHEQVMSRPEHFVNQNITALRERLAQQQMQPCAGRNCGSTNPNLHSAECFEDYENATGMEQPTQPGQESCGWQFYAAGKWHNGMEANDHRVNTEAAGIPTRNVYPGPVAQPEQEPVAWMHTKIEGVAVPHRPADLDKHPERWEALYTSPPAQRKPLTDEEIERACVPLGAAMLSFTEIARAIEAAHGIKG